MERRHAAGDLLICTADDFGLAPEINEAVEIAHQAGVLSAASLMVGGPAAADAAQRARRMQRLRVGLHLVLTEGTPVLPANELRGLVNSSGRFHKAPFAMGWQLGLSAGAQRQLETEIEAQLAAFHATGLRLDHINCHQHIHLHPAVGGLLLRVAREHGLRAIRVPRESLGVLKAVEPSTRPIPLIERACAAWLDRRIRRAGLVSRVAVYGRTWTGAMTPRRVAALIDRLPPGPAELYFHPATADKFGGSAAGYHYADELAALTAEEVRTAVISAGRKLGGYADLVA